MNYPDLGNANDQRYGRSLRVASSAHHHDLDHSTFSTMLNRSEYQPIAQAVDDDEADVVEPVPSSSAHRPRSSSIVRKIDLGKLDNAFKRCVSRMTFCGVFQRLVADGPSPLLRR